MVPSAYLRLLIFLPAILIPTYDSSRSAFRMMYSGYNLNKQKQGDNIPCVTTQVTMGDSMFSFPNFELVSCSMSRSNCCFLTCTQISQEAGKVVWYSHLLKDFLQFVVIHTVKGFGDVKKAEVDVLLEHSCFFHDPADVGNLISGSSAFSKSSPDICKFTVHVLLKPGLENFEHYFANV